MKKILYKYFGGELSVMKNMLGNYFGGNVMWNEENVM